MTGSIPVRVAGSRMVGMGRILHIAAAVCLGLEVLGVALFGLPLLVLGLFLWCVSGLV